MGAAAKGAGAGEHSHTTGRCAERQPARCAPPCSRHVAAAAGEPHLLSFEGKRRAHGDAGARGERASRPDTTRSSQARKDEASQPLRGGFSFPSPLLVSPFPMPCLMKSSLMRLEETAQLRRAAGGATLTRASMARSQRLSVPTGPPAAALCPPRMIRTCKGSRMRYALAQRPQSLM